MKINRRMLLNTATLTAMLLFLSGCAGGLVAMNDAQRAEVRKASRINVIYHGPMGPVIQTAGDAIKFHFSMGLAGWGTPGQQIMKDNGIEDPLIELRQRFMDRVAAEGGMRNMGAGQSPAPRDLIDVAELQKHYRKGLHLQLVPTQWTVIYYVADWSRYHMYYGVLGRLVRADDGKVLWSAACGINRDDGDKAPTRDQLMANRAARLKTWARDAARECADTLADAFLGKST